MKTNNIKDSIEKNNIIFTNNKSLIIKRLENALRMNLHLRIKSVFPSIHPDIQAKLIEELEPEDRKKLIYILESKIKLHLLIKLSPKTRYEVIGYLNKSQSSLIIEKLLLKDVVIEELEREIELMKNQKDSMFNTITSSISQRISWLIISVILSSMSSFVVDSYSILIEKFVIITALMPVIANISNITEGQTTTILVRDLGRVDNLFKDWKRVVLRETIIGFSIGFILSIITYISIFIWQRNHMLSLCFSLSVWIVQGIACFFGATIPLIFQKMKLDPALGADMIAATIINVVSFIVLFKMTISFLN
jgi:Mg/Co/Ni transporter MgtE